MPPSEMARVARAMAVADITRLSLPAISGSAVSTTLAARAHSAVLIWSGRIWGCFDFTSAASPATWGAA